MSDPDFEPFVQKGGKLVTTNTASVTISSHGVINIPSGVRSQIFDGAGYIQYHADTENCLLAFEPFQEEEDAPANAYKVGEGGSVNAERVLSWLGKSAPEEITMFELQTDGELAYIDVGDLPEVEE